MDKNKILKEWRDFENSFKVRGADQKKIIPNLTKLFDKIKKGEIKV